MQSYASFDVMEGKMCTTFTTEFLSVMCTTNFFFRCSKSNEGQCKLQRTKLIMCKLDLEIMIP